MRKKFQRSSVNTHFLIFAALFVFFALSAVWILLPIDLPKTRDPLPVSAASAGRSGTLFLDDSEVTTIRNNLDKEPLKKEYSLLLQRAEDALNDPKVYSVTTNGGPSNLTKHYFKGADHDFVVGKKASEQARDLALAYRLSGRTEFAEKADKRLREWFLNSDTYMISEIPSAASVGEHVFIHTMLYTGVFLPTFYYAADLLEPYSGWTDDELNRLKSWAKNYGEQAVKKHVAGGRVSTNNSGWRTLFVLASGAYSQDDTLLRIGLSELNPSSVFKLEYYVDTSFQYHDGIKRIISYQIDSEGKLLNEIARGKNSPPDPTLYYSLFAISPIIQSAEIARHYGRDIYNWVSPMNGSIAKALNFHAPYLVGSKNWPYPNTNKSGQYMDPYTQTEGYAMYELGYKIWKKPEYVDVLKKYQSKIGLYLNGQFLASGFNHNLGDASLTHTVRYTPVVPNETIRPTPAVTPTRSALPTASPISPGESINQSVWSGLNVSVNASISSLTSDSRFPSNPTEVRQLSGLNSQYRSFRDNYGSRIIGEIRPSTSGLYTFYVSGDDAVDFYLSSNSLAVNKRRVAYTSAWTFPQQWTKYSSQKSSSVSLLAGGRYYFEVLHVESIGEDHFSIGWTTPTDNTIKLVPTENVFPLSIVSTPVPIATAPPISVTLEAEKFTSTGGDVVVQGQETKPGVLVAENYIYRFDPNDYITYTLPRGLAEYSKIKVYMKPRNGAGYIEVLGGGSNAPVIGRINNLPNTGLAGATWQEVHGTLNTSRLSTRTLTLRAKEQYQIGYIDKIVLSE